MTVPVVLDCGSGFTKLGFAGNVRPSCTLPTAVPTDAASTSGQDWAALASGLAGEAAPGTAPVQCTFPVRQGLVSDWDAMERFWQHCLVK